ncbi:MAG: protein translocase subunit SecD [Nitrospiraceae bacterium]|nr:protein translocase subunit SecD [Nitrospiraceae bacterium]
MKTSIQWRLGLILLSVVVALALFLPSTPAGDRLPEWWKGNVSKIALGLDLRGGSHLVMQVETDKAVEASLDNIAADLQTTAASQKLEGVTFARSGQTIVAKFPEAMEDQVADFVKKTYAVLEYKSRAKGEMTYAPKAQWANGIKEDSVRQAKERTERRINKFGVAEPNVYKQGVDQLVIQLPGIKNPQEAISFIKTAGRLEFKLVDTESDLGKALAGKVPEGREILYGEGVGESGKINRQPYLLYSQTLLTGDRLKEAKVGIDEYGKPSVSITFDADGAKIFERITGENVGRQLAIVLDGVVHSAPRIKDRISGGSAQITGNFTHDEAARLAIVLRESLPAPMKIVQNVTIGPSLGQDSINKGVHAALVGGLVVVVFMVVYYGLSGLIADYAIVLNLVLLLGAMAVLNATLTLPGIAGIILTIGMGVDSNVLMFERIREEIRAGKPPRPAVDSGYDKAFLTILDSHVTTLITAAMLFMFGTGPIKGFAVSLSLGIIINLYSALVGTKVIFDIINTKWKLEKLSI